MKKKTMKTDKPSATSKVKSPSRKTAVKPAAKAGRRSAPKTASTESPTVAAVESLRQEITTLRSQLAKHLAPVTTGTLEEVDALRRVLNDLMEARLNNVIRELVSIRNTAASAGAAARHITEQMDTLLADLGAQKFEAERLEHVDPLIHTVTREAYDARLPDGVVTETIRPGFHTGHGIVVAKALVAVNRRA